MSAVLRAHHALRAAGLVRNSHDQVHLERLTHAVNEVWRYGDFIIRINPHPRSHRLQDEARLLLYLPAEVRAPSAVAAGQASWGEWAISGRLPGTELSRAWSTMRRADRQRAITELAGVLRALHGVVAPRQVPAGDPDRCPHPLPVSRLMGLLADAAELPGADPAVFAAAAERLAQAGASLHEQSRTLVHGDLHLENVLTDDASISGLLDFEWSRPGPPDLDLDILLHSIADPSLHLQSGIDEPLHRRDFDAVVGWLRAAYPELFAHPDLAERLWVYRLAYDVRDLLDQGRGPALDPATLPPHHPYQRILKLLAGRSEVGWFLAG